MVMMKPFLTRGADMYRILQTGENNLEGRIELAGRSTIPRTMKESLKYSVSNFHSHLQVSQLYFAMDWNQTHQKLKELDEGVKAGKEKLLSNLETIKGILVALSQSEESGEVSSRFFSSLITDLRHDSSAPSTPLTFTPVVVDLFLFPRN